MKMMPCETGPLFDETGVRYCPLKPWDDYNCDECTAAWLDAEERRAELKREVREEREEERDIWGG